MEKPIHNGGYIYALDIGTRNVIGVLAKESDSRVEIVAIETEPHAKRTMMDGQIEDIAQVAKVVATVTNRLEKRIGNKLSCACVAAAGRALRTEHGHAIIEFDGVQVITADHISRLEAQAVSDAELALKTENNNRMFLVGYTPTDTFVDGYAMHSLVGHTGLKLEATVVATFLPSEVIESLYSVMKLAKLEVASLTLEPIAALNAAIPAELRLLNLALVDIGAGTSDIAICRDASVTGYTMATIAGDEITESIMKSRLVDYKSAEEMKSKLSGAEPIVYTDILGIESTVSPSDLLLEISDVTNELANAISQCILSVNKTAPSAVFLAGGGSKLFGLQKAVASVLNMDENRVAIAGGHFKNSAFSDEHDINNPEYTTPLGIAISAALGLISDSYRVLLNGEVAKLFRSGSLTVLEILMMNGYTYQDLLGRNGKNLVIEVDGARKVFAGEISTPAVLTVNGVDAKPTTVINAGDNIVFKPAGHGADKGLTVGELLQKLEAEAITVNDLHPLPSDIVLSGSVVKVIAYTHSRKATAAKKAEKPTAPTAKSTSAKTTYNKNSTKPAAGKSDNDKAKADLNKTANTAAEPIVKEKAPKDELPVQNTEQGEVFKADTPKYVQKPAEQVFILNGKELTLAPKQNGEAYFLMDLLDHTGLDFKNLSRPVTLSVNGIPGVFRQVLKPGDIVNIK